MPFAELKNMDEKTATWKRINLNTVFIFYYQNLSNYFFCKETNNKSNSKHFILNKLK